MKCKLEHSGVRNVVALGTIHHSLSQHIVHGFPLRADCYKVSIDEAIKPASFLPIEAGELKTVEDACGSFMAWPKTLVILDTKDNKKQMMKKRKMRYTTLNQLKKQSSKRTRGAVNKKTNVLDDE